MLSQLVSYSFCLKNSIKSVSNTILWVCENMIYCSYRFSRKYSLFVSSWRTLCLTFYLKLNENCVKKITFFKETLVSTFPKEDEFLSEYFQRIFLQLSLKTLPSYSQNKFEWLLLETVFFSAKIKSTVSM